jgi:hypothetical protein
MERAGTNLQPGLMPLNPSFPSAYVFLPLHLQIFGTAIVLIVKNFDFVRTFADSHTDFLAFNDRIFESEFMFTV